MSPVIHAHMFNKTFGYCKAIFVMVLLLSGTGITGDGMATTGWKGPCPDYSRVELCRNAVGSYLSGSVGPSVPSAVVMVLYRDNVLFLSGKNASEDTAFGIASLSKIFTSIIVLSLVEEGRLKLGDAVSCYTSCGFVPKTACGGTDATVGQLLAHTAGVPSWAGNNGPYPVVYPGGACYEYANAGYCILKKVIENASEDSYENLVRSRIFLPLGMNSSSAGESNGTGGIVSTARDLSRFAMMLIGEGELDGKRIISRKSFSMMLQPSLDMPPAADDYYYSLGWEVVKKNGSVFLYYKAGRWFNEGTGLQVYPHLKAAVLYTCNPPDHRAETYMKWRNGLMGMLNSGLSNIFHDSSLRSAWPLQLFQNLELYQGIYREQSGGNCLQILRKDGILVVKNGKDTVKLSPFSSLRYLDPYGHIYSFVWKDGRMRAIAAGSHYYILQP